MSATPNMPNIATDQLQAAPQKPNLFLKRLGAYFIDGILVSIAWVLLFFVYGLALSLILPSSAAGEEASAITALLAFAFTLVLMGAGIAFWLFYYIIAANKFEGASVGKKLIGLRVVVKNTNEAPSSVKIALRYSLGYILSGFLWYIGFLWALFDKNQETWHDKIFDTHVVETE